MTTEMEKNRQQKQKEKFSQYQEIKNEKTGRQSQAVWYPKNEDGDLVTGIQDIFDKCTKYFKKKILIRPRNS